MVVVQAGQKVKLSCHRQLSADPSADRGGCSAALPVCSWKSLELPEKSHTAKILLAANMCEDIL